MSLCRWPSLVYSALMYTFILNLYHPIAASARGVGVQVILCEFSHYVHNLALIPLLSFLIVLSDGLGSYTQK